MTPPRSEWLTRFRRYLTTERRLSPHTDTNYALDLAALVRTATSEALEDWHALDSQHVRTVRRALARGRAGAAEASSGGCRAVRTFFEFLMRETLVLAKSRDGAPDATRRTMSRIPRSRSARQGAARLPNTLDADQMARLLELPAGDALRRRATAR